MAKASTEEDFFVEQSEASKIKARIVFNYFVTWASIIGSTASKIGYLDFFCGPGKYEDGNESTPLLILKKAVEVPKIGKSLVTIFQDSNVDYIDRLRKCVAEIDGIKTLKYAPYIEAQTMDEEVVKQLKKIELIPSLIFIDPFGYKGLSKDLLGTAIKDWGCDCIFFFNYNRINAAITNPAFTDNVNLIFGEDIANELRAKVESLNPELRQKLVLEKLALALSKVKGKFKIEFKFYKEDSEKTSHFLILITKHARGYEVMKEVMAKLCDTDEGIPTYEYRPLKERKATGDMFAKTTGKLFDLGETLKTTYKGKKKTVITIYREHNVGTPFILSNYKKALMMLEGKGEITVDVPAASRRKIKGELTLGDDRLITFK